MNIKHTLSNATILTLLAAALPACAQQETPTIQQLEEQINAQEKALEKTRQSLERLKIQMQAPGGSVSASAPGSSRPGTSPQSEEPVGKAPPNPQESSAAKVAPILEQPGILTPRGGFVLEPSLQYDYSNNNQVNLIGFSVLPAILVGLVDVREVDTSTLTAALTMRYGLTNRLELNARVPYVYGHQSSSMRPIGEGASSESVFTNSGRGIGDIQVGARYQFNDGGRGIPYLIGSLTATLPTGRGPFDVRYSTVSTVPGTVPLQEEQPTGSGFYALDAGILAIYPSDPAVFFGGLDYIWRPPKDVDKNIGALHIGRVDPGDSIKLSFGMGVSLNDKASFSIGYQHSFVMPTKYENDGIGNSKSIQIGQLLIGYGYQLSPHTNLNLTLGVGLTKYAPNAELLLRVPVSF